MVEYKDIISDVASFEGMSYEFVDKVYRAYWKAVREHIKSIPLKERLDEDTFKSFRPNVNIPSIGKLYITYDRYSRIMTSAKDIIDKKTLNKKLRKQKQYATH